MVVYVDDMVITGSNTKYTTGISKLKSFLKSKSHAKDLGVGKPP